LAIYYYLVFWDPVLCLIDQKAYIDQKNNNFPSGFYFEMAIGLLSYVSYLL
jgi:hypothetical protein